MIKMKTRFVTVIILFVILPGCLSGFPGLGESGDYDLSVKEVNETRQDGSIRFAGTIQLSGSLGSGAVVHDIMVTFVDQNDSRLATVDVGMLSIGQIAGGQPRAKANISILLEKRPNTVMIETGAIETESEVEIYGMRRNSEGGFDYFLIDSKR